MIIMANIRIEDDTKAALDELGKKNDSYDDIIKKLISIAVQKVTPRDIKAPNTDIKAPKGIKAPNRDIKTPKQKGEWI